MVELGDSVKDKVTGFRGVAVARYIFLNGCDRYSVQPGVKKDGTLPEAQTFDEPQLGVIRSRAAKTGNRKTGGPAPYLPKPKPEPI